MLRYKNLPVSLKRISKKIGSMHMNKELTSAAGSLPDRIDKALQAIGKVFMWSNVVLIVLILGAVFMRYVLKFRTIGIGELQWHFYMVGFMFGLSYAVTTDSHMGMDLVREKLSEKTQLWLNTLGILFLLLPFACLVFYQSLEFVRDSWVINERSNNDMGLPFRWLIKSVLPVSFGLLILAAFSRLLRNIIALFKKDMENAAE